MSDHTGDNAWQPPEGSGPSQPGAVPPTPDSSTPLSPPPVPPAGAGSALPPPPARPIPTTVTTGPVEASPPRGPRWVGRVLALGAAAALIGGGGYLAINAGAADGGAATPQGALEGVLDALTNEDLVGAAEFVEPTERETMIDAGFDVVDELIRLEVFSDDLDLRSIGGIDLDFRDIEIDMTEVRPGVAQLFLDGGRVSATVNGAEFPFGSLITDRIDAETLAVVESNSTRIEPTEYPIVAVQRDGRWYLSLWYSVAENARIALDQPLPGNERPDAIGGDSPERAIELFVGAMTGVDLASMIGMLDPEEAAALYDYAPLFLDDAQSEVDDLLAEARRDGWRWDVSDLQLTSESDGRLATVVIDSFAFEASGPGTTVEVVYSGDRSRIWFDTEGQTVEIIADGECVTTTFDDGFGVQTDEFCASDMAEMAGLEALTGGAFANLQSMSAPGIVVREVDGRWFISPLRTGSTLMLDALRSIEADALAETVDAFAEFFEDPFAFGAGFGSSPFGGSFGPGFGSGSGFGPAEDPGFFGDPGPATTAPGADGSEASDYTDENAALLSPEFEYGFVYDLSGSYRGDPWRDWLTSAQERPYGRGVAGDVFVEDLVFSIVVLSEISIASDEELAEWVNGELIVDADLSYVRGETNWGGAFAVARTTDDGIVIVGLWNGWDDRALGALRTQLDMTG